MSRFLGTKGHRGRVLAVCKLPDHLRFCGAGRRWTHRLRAPFGVVVRMLQHVAAVLVWAAALTPGCARAQAAGLETAAGEARVIDGDTIEIKGLTHRLRGIDAPERRQTCLDASARPWPCGQRAMEALAAHIAARPVTCVAQTFRPTDRYGRRISTCYVHGQDLNAWLVRHGWALAYRKYSEDYVPDEAIAKTNRRGLWQGDFTPPWSWRKGR